MIYLDSAATTRPNETAIARANKFITEEYFNPSARYGGGASVHAEIERAREFLTAQIASCDKFSLVFTSCGTEADNQAVFTAGKRGNAVTDGGEHSAVFKSFIELKNRGVEPRFAPVLKDGRVDSDALLSLVDEKTSLVSVVHVNNETGAVNDINELARRVKAKNPRTVFHSDGVQAYGKVPVRLTENVDLYSLSAHKIGGLKGTGALIRRKKFPLQAFLFGGGQEGELRSGTENTYGIAVFRYAAEQKFRTLAEDGKRLLAYRELLFDRLDKELFARISPNDGSPYILTVSASGMRGEVLQRMLWEKGVAVGTGSACSSKKPHSRILESCGYGKEMLDGVLRVSFCSETKEEEVLHCAEAMNAVASEYKKKLG